MYVDAFYDREKEVVNVVERVNGERIYKTYPARYFFYYKDDKGKYESIYGEKLSRVNAKNKKEFYRELKIHEGKTLYESDISQISKCLEEFYLNADLPDLHIAFFDIESSFDEERGFAPPSDPFLPITAITVYLKWLDKLVTLAIPPKTLTMQQAEEICADIENCFLFDSEAEMLDTFLEIIDDADIISGWNSEGYDIPYTINRIAQVLSKEDTRRFCLFDQFPKKKEYEKFGKITSTYELTGRIHLDSLELYRKFTYEERHSYRLDAIGEMEIGENKTVYQGTLDSLYKNDFRKFIEYNRQDVAILGKLDKKLKFINLSNAIAHANTVLLPQTLGSVAVTEQAIVNEAHRRNMIVPDRRSKEIQDETKAAGAYVAYPKKGLHDWIGSMDINSLYPSTIRALNMGPETIVGQLKPTKTEAYINEQINVHKKSFAAAWEGLFGTLEYTAVMKRERNTVLTIEWENGTDEAMTAENIYHMIFNPDRKWMLSANGTIFTTEFEGVIPGLLKRWFEERKVMQAILEDWEMLENGIEIDHELADQISKLLEKQ
jgi:DNA polymerase elongation subunit (family B)